MKSKPLIAGAAFWAALFLFSGFILYRKFAGSKQSADDFESGLVPEEPAADPTGLNGGERQCLILK